jgi:hypothetical protein
VKQGAFRANAFKAARAESHWRVFEKKILHIPRQGIATFECAHAAALRLLPQLLVLVDRTG